MTTSQKPQPTLTEIATWLNTQHDDEIVDLTPLSGGFWSSAYAYRAGTDAYVLRFGHSFEGFEIDEAAMRFRSADVPVPAFFARGTALGFHYAITQRHYGRFVENVDATDGDAVGGALSKLLVGLRGMPAFPHTPVVWYDPKSTTSWHDWLRGGLVDHPNSHTAGWRKTLANDPRLDSLFRQCESRIEELLPLCPERRDLIHGDLLHQNVLVSEDASEVTGIFSWKCSARGDFLFDVAWCTFWSDWHPGIAAANMWQRTLNADDLSEADLLNAPARHHCYELQIGASHLGWCVWVGDNDDLMAVANATERVLERGSLPRK